MPTVTIRDTTHRKLKTLKRVRGWSIAEAIDRLAGREISLIDAEKEHTEGTPGTDALASTPPRSSSHS
jgi:predicted CopG family antitoxin